MRSARESGCRRLSSRAARPMRARFLGVMIVETNVEFRRACPGITLAGLIADIDRGEFERSKPEIARCRDRAARC